MSNLVIPIFCAIFSSVGFWTFVNNIYQDHREKESAERKALLGLLHEKLCDKVAEYQARGEITQQEYRDLHKFIYDPYKELGGNGTGDKMMKAVEDIPVVVK